MSHLELFSYVTRTLLQPSDLNLTQWSIYYTKLCIIVTAIPDQNGVSLKRFHSCQCKVIIDSHGNIKDAPLSKIMKAFAIQKAHITFPMEDMYSKSFDISENTLIHTHGMTAGWLPLIMHSSLPLWQLTKVDFFFNNLAQYNAVYTPWWRQKLPFCQWAWRQKLCFCQWAHSIYVTGFVHCLRQAIEPG